MVVVTLWLCSTITTWSVQSVTGGNSAIITPKILKKLVIFQHISNSVLTALIKHFQQRQTLDNTGTLNNHLFTLGHAVIGIN